VPVNLPCSVAPIRYSWPVPRDAIDSNSEDQRETVQPRTRDRALPEATLAQAKLLGVFAELLFCGTSARSPAVPLDLIQGVDHSGVVGDGRPEVNVAYFVSSVHLMPLSPVTTTKT
jgi:hypothetical protein